jgi:hypothetical protein
MIYIIPLIIISVLFVVFLIIGNPSELASKDWFKKTRFDNSWWMLFSLLATNLSISGGIIASISGAKYYGMWFLVAPLSAAIGLFVFAVYHRRLSSYDHRDRVFISDIASGESSPIMMGYCAASVTIGAFIAGWEIHIASQAIVSFYSEITFVSANVFSISIFIAFMAGLYISKGGWDRSVFTDVIQTVGVLFFIVLLSYILLNQTDSYTLNTKQQDISLLSLGLFVAALFINNIGFSLINTNNWQIAQSAEKKSGWIFLVGGIVLFLFSFVIYYLSYYITSNNPFSIFSAQNITTAILVAVVPLFVWSTIDTSSVALSNLADDILSKHISESEESLQLRKLARKNYPLIFLVSAVLISHLLNTFNPNIFHSLLAATSSLIVYVPMVLAPLFVSEKNYLSSKQCGIAMFVLFIVVITASVAMTMAGKGEWIFSLSLIGFGAGTIVINFYNKL